MNGAGEGGAALARLLAASLAAWRVRGEVRLAETGEVAVRVRETSIGVAPAAQGLPFRWLVTVNGRERPAVSVVAVLRQVRHAVDPGFRTTRVRVAPPEVSPR